jgi:glutathione-specific gamma-glutamylcyclotransferase
LTITPHAEAEVAGVVIPEHRDDLSGLDAREEGYQRIRLTLVADKPRISPAQAGLETFTYVSTPATHRRGSREFPIWRSYLECVLAGFLDLGGNAAAHDFIATTDAWEVPILDDRRAPKYMRAVPLSPHEQGKVEALIHSHGLDSTQFADPTALLPVTRRSADGDEFG